MAGDLRGQLIEAVCNALHAPCLEFQRLHGHEGSTQHGPDAHLSLAENVTAALLPAFEAYAVEREKAMRERCAKAVEAESPTRAHTGCVGSSTRTKHFPLSQDEWAAVVRAVPVDGEGTPEPKGQTP